MRTLGGQFRKLPELEVHRPSLRLRGDTLWVTIEHDGKWWLSKKPWIRLDVGPDASDLEILAATKRAIDEYKQAQEGADLPVASGSLATYRRQALQEIDSLKLSVKVTAQRGRHLDKLCSWLDERGLPTEEDNLLNYLRTIPLESRNRREGETAARLLLMTAKRQKLKIPRGELWKRPAPKKNEPLDSDAVIAAILRLVKVFPESGWLTAMVALTGSRGAMVMSSEVLWNPVPIESGTYIRCRDDKKGRSREANLCPSWKDLLLALPKGFIDNPPEMLKEARKPFDRAPTQKEQRTCEQRMVYISNKTRSLQSAEDRQLLDFRQLRHHRAHALLDANLDLLRVSELLSTSPDMIVKTYADHHRFKAAEDVKRIFD